MPNYPMPEWAVVPPALLLIFGVTVEDRSLDGLERAFSLTWTEPDSGIRCEVFVGWQDNTPGKVRPLSFVNGYVWPPEGCPVFDSVDVEVPGGVTYPSDGVWCGNGKAGFDTQHSSMPREEFTVVRVMHETRSFAEQVAALCSPSVLLLSAMKNNQEGDER
jgi:hypothetical protein